MGIISFVIGIAILIVILKILTLPIKLIIKFVINSILGGIVLAILSFFGIGIVVYWWTFLWNRNCCLLVDYFISRIIRDSRACYWNNNCNVYIV